jgi:hypothetical protein
MKKNNPYVPILIREASGTEPRVFARYGASLIPLESSHVEVDESATKKEG